jgi:hypothetical protein
MRGEFLCYLTQAWTADRYWEPQPDAPGQAPRRARHSRRSPHAPRARELPAVVARHLRTVP